MNQLEQIVLEPPGFGRHVLSPAHRIGAFTSPTASVQHLGDDKTANVEPIIKEPHAGSRLSEYLPKPSKTHVLVGR